VRLASHCFPECHQHAAHLVDARRESARRCRARLPKRYSLAPTRPSGEAGSLGRGNDAPRSLP
jgi:hypothetical protein